MRSGVVALMPAHPREITPSTAERLRVHGFTGVTVIVPDPITATREEYERAGAILRDGGVSVAQANPRYEILIHPDDARRALAIRGLRAACECAKWLGAGTTYVRPGSLNPDGPWTPHPENASLRTLLRLVDSLGQVVSAAEEVGVPLAIEAGAGCPLNSAETVRDVIEAVGSPALRFNADPVNLVASWSDVYNTTTLTNRLFDLCGRYVVCAHAKDITYQSTLTLRLDECPLGEGHFDQVTYLRRFEECCPDGFMLIEHLADDQVPAAKRNLDRAAERAGLSWK